VHNIKPFSDHQALCYKLAEHRSALKDAMAAGASAKVTECRRAMFAYLAKLDPMAFDLHDSGISRTRREIISILAEADQYLGYEKEKMRLKNLHMPDNQLACRNADETFIPAKLTSNLIQTTKKLRAIRKKMVEHRILVGG
jgi:hypothetical protein